MKSFQIYFSRAIRDRYPDRAYSLIASIGQHYKAISVDTQFAATSRNPIDKRLDFCACFLALIKTLDEQGESYETIREVCLNVVTSYVKPKNKWQEVLKKLPPMLLSTWLASVFLKAFSQRVSQKAHPDGFRAILLTDKQETLGFGYGIDILECGICKLFQKHNYRQYASILCEVDKITSGLAGLELVRTGTIANGALMCDFRFRKPEA